VLLLCVQIMPGAAINIDPTEQPILETAYDASVAALNALPEFVANTVLAESNENKPVRLDEYGMYDLSSVTVVNECEECAGLRQPQRECTHNR